MSIKNKLQKLLNRLLNSSEINQKLDRLVDEMQIVRDQAMRQPENGEIAQKIDQLTQQLLALEHTAGYVDKGTQLLLGDRYRGLLANGETLSFSDVAFRNHSQSSEDGILWYIFSLIGTENKKTIEICAGNGKECNSANLIINHGWLGLLVEGDEHKVAIANKYFGAHPDSRIIPPNVIREWVTVENVNDIINKKGFDGEVDLFCLDLDGIDYWIWNAITTISPRVVVVEYQSVWGCTRAVTVPYRPDFEYKQLSDGGYGRAWYCGASLPAYVKLAKEKGYRLIGGNHLGFNAFFMRNDVGVDIFPEIPPEQLFTHPVVKFNSEASLYLHDDQEWVDV